MRFRDAGWDVDLAATESRGLERVRRGSYDAIVLEMMLPHVDVFTLCQAVRQTTPYTPVLMLTARADELDGVLGLELGADDYLDQACQHSSDRLTVWGIGYRFRDPSND